MLFNWDTRNLCLVFPQWRVTGTLSLFLSLLGVVLLCAGYELVRSLTRRYEASSAEYLNQLPSMFMFPFPLSELGSEERRERGAGCFQVPKAEHLALPF